MTFYLAPCYFPDEYVLASPISQIRERFCKSLHLLLWREASLPHSTYNWWLPQAGRQIQLMPCRTPRGLRLRCSVLCMQGSSGSLWQVLLPFTVQCQPVSMSTRCWTPSLPLLQPPPPPMPLVGGAGIMVSWSLPPRQVTVCWPWS